MYCDLAYFHYSFIHFCDGICGPDECIYLVNDIKTNETAAVDTPCAKTYQAELDKRGWTLTHIFNTHHHWDHTVSARALTIGTLASFVHLLKDCQEILLTPDSPSGLRSYSNV